VLLQQSERGACFWAQKELGQWLQLPAVTCSSAAATAVAAAVFAGDGMGVIFLKHVLKQVLQLRA
jgi:hypothetical protein